MGDQNRIVRLRRQRSDRLVADVDLLELTAAIKRQRLSKQEILWRGDEQLDEALL